MLARDTHAGARMAETLELATIWVVDLVGSTRSARVGDTDAQSSRAHAPELLNAQMHPGREGVLVVARARSGRAPSWLA